MCVGPWDFAKAPWLLVKPGPEDQTMLDDIKQAAAQFPTWLNVMVKVHADLSWAESKIIDQSQDCIDKLKSCAQDFKKAT